MANFDWVCLSIISLTQRWSVYTENPSPLQLKRKVHFGFVARQDDYGYIVYGETIPKQRRSMSVASCKTPELRCRRQQSERVLHRHGPRAAVRERNLLLHKRQLQARLKFASDINKDKKDQF